MDVGGLSEAFRSIVSVGAGESLDKSVSQLSEELDAKRACLPIRRTIWPKL